MEFRFNTNYAFLHVLDDNEKKLLESKSYLEDKLKDLDSSEPEKYTTITTSEKKINEEFINWENKYNSTKNTYLFTGKTIGFARKC